MADVERKDATPINLGQFTATAAQVQLTAWAVQLVFGEASVTPGEKANEVPRIVVAVPWPLAKVLHRVLGMAIERYEAQEGTIAVPRSILASLEAGPKSVKPGDV